MLNVLRVIDEVGNGCTEPLHCSMENGEYAIVKKFNNVQSNKSLVNELICYKLAKVLELPIPSGGICNIDCNTMDKNNFITSDNYGLGFYSKRIDKVTVLNNSQIIQMITNKSDIPKCIVFDHLIYNTDRNPGNILLSQKNKEVRLSIIDHTHVFNKQLLWDRDQLKQCIENKDYLENRIMKENSSLYRYIFQGMSIELDELLLISKEFKDKISRNTIKNIFQLIPEEWDTDVKDLNVLEDYLMCRLEKLDTICSIINDNKSY